MTFSLTAACFWLVLANVLGMLPSRDNHWQRAYILIGLGLPLLAWVFWENGWFFGLLVLAAGMSVLRWPLRALIGWLARLFRGKADNE